MTADAESSDTDSLTFETDILPLFQRRCFECHGETKQRSGLDLRTFVAARRGGDSGPGFAPSQPAESPIYEYVSEGLMPPENPLSKKEIALIRRWLETGAASAAVSDVASAALPDVFEHKVLPIFHNRCVVCHGAQEQKAGLDLRSRESMLRGGKSGPAIVPGEVEESLLVQMIVAEKMPPKKDQRKFSVRPLPDDELDLLKRWIAAGAPQSPSEYYTEPEGPGRAVTDEDRQFWAYQPPVRPPVPHGTDDRRVCTPIDAFLLERLQRKGLSFSAEASRETLIRRLYFNLIGLPPEPEEVRAFVEDSAEDAYDRLVDRLLDSPHYGERWAIPWLDAAGYAESEGRSRGRYPRPHAWRYRDYVIRSLNADKPYDQFLMEQIAGDELVESYRSRTLTPQEADRLIATGFLRMAPDATADERINFVTDRWEVIDGQLRVLGSAVLASTIGCARCHSHKFDPVPQRDYFALAGIFGAALDTLNWRHSGERYLKVKVQSPDDDDPQTITVRALFDLDATPSPTYLHVRGNPLALGRVVSPAPPAVFSKSDEAFVIEPPENGNGTSGRRLALARWLTRPDHPATARVIVNRLWQQHFGRGIVETVENFGPAGARPSHLELLDWLATELVARGWSLKEMHRLIVTSTAYRQSSQRTAELERADPGNELVSRMPLRRLEAEELRDAMLKIAGRLDPEPYGRPAAVAGRLGNIVAQAGPRGERRSVYVSAEREQLPTMLETFDKPQLSPNCLTRDESTVVQQALLLMNSKEVRDLARRFAQRIAREAGPDDESRIRQAWLQALGRDPQAGELQLAIDTLRRLRGDWSASVHADEANLHALTGVCHALFNSAEFLYLD